MRARISEEVERDTSELIDGQQQQPTLAQRLGSGIEDLGVGTMRMFFNEPPDPNKRPLHREVFRVLLEAHSMRRTEDLWELKDRLESGEFDDEYHEQYLAGLYDALRYSMDENVELPLTEDDDD